MFESRTLHGERTPEELKEALRKEWSYEFEAWDKFAGFDPVAVCASEDLSASYDMEKATVFENADGKYVLVTESGCSCYCASDADMEFFPDKEAAMRSFANWCKRDENGFRL